MNILTAENLTKAYGDRKLFDQASFYLEEGEKVGIIGINGTGKSTLLQMIAGLEEPEEGAVVTAGHVIIEYLPQHPVFSEQETVLRAAYKGVGGVERGLAGPSESDARAMLTRMGVTDYDALCGTLSGGQKKRLALVAALLSPADILLLDEPTNHLDYAMAEWLEEALRGRKGAVVMVTHDRYFLDSVTDRIVEIDKGQIYSYRTSYSGYLERKAEREEAALSGERKRQSLLRTELAWVRRGAQARSTKQKARLERYDQLRQAKTPVPEGRVQMGSVSSRLGKMTVEISHLSKKYEKNQLISDFSYIFLKGDRVGFIGQNGCGKTTLMKLLTGETEPDEGTVEKGQTVKIGYYSQEISEADMPPEKRVIDYIRDVAEYVSTEEGVITASQMLERFLFPGSEQYTPLGKLSGGEKRRLGLLRVLMGAPNVLLLDEPTNDLDIATLTVLEDYLDRFEGIVAIVSHDRYFLDRTVRRIFAFEEGGRLRQYEGGYSDYLLTVRGEEKKAAPWEENGGKAKKSGETPGQEEKPVWKTKQKRLKFTFQEQRDYETIEADIAELEERLQEISEECLLAATDFVKLNELTKKKEETEKRLEERMERWMYLEQLLESIKRQNGE